MMAELKKKARILFVDDEQKVLEGLERMLHSMRKEWHMTFINSGKDALAIMQHLPFDVVISDMRMPEMDGAELLGEVKKLYPQTVCFILSGYSDKEMILKTVGPADRFLNKPCSAQELKESISKALKARGSIGDKESLMAMVAGMKRLPTMPALYTKLQELLNSKNSSLKDISDVIAKDISMTAKALQLVNSAFFGLRHQIKDINHAVVYLGIETIKAIIITTDVFSKFTPEEVKVFDIKELYKHSIITGVLASKIAATISEELVDPSAMAGMLHDIGKIIFIQNKAEEYKAVCERYRKERIPYHVLEKEWIDTNHAEIGGYLMSVWGLPSKIVDAISFHHQPLTSEKSAIVNVTTVIHIANYLYYKLCNLEEEAGSRLDERYVQQLALKKDIGKWMVLGKPVVEKRDETEKLFQ